MKKYHTKENEIMHRKFKEYKSRRIHIHFETLQNEQIGKELSQDAKVAIIIPYRNREEHLKKCKEHFQNSSFDIYVIEQMNSQKFNRGILLNIGFDLAKKNKDYDYYIFHDVDSLPDEELMKLYMYKGQKIIHYASPDLGYKYDFPTFLGGVLGMTREDYEKINGYPNFFFGWGGEDDAVYDRIGINRMKVYRPSKGKYILLDHPQATFQEENPRKWEGLPQNFKEWKRDGLSELDSLYIILSESITQNPNLYFYKVKIPFYHEKHMEYKSLMRPLITWREVERNVLETYTEPILFKTNKNNANKEMKNVIEEKVLKEYEKGVSVDDLKSTLKLLFDVYREVLYFRIRQGGIEFAFHIYNKDFENRWHKFIQFPKNTNYDSFMKKRNQNLHPWRGELTKPDLWTGIDCVVSLENWRDAGNPTEYVKEMYELVSETVKLYKGKIPDCDLIINRKDLQVLHQDPTRYAYTHVFPANVKIPNPPKKYWFVLSQSTTDHNKDIPIPNADDWRIASKPVMKPLNIVRKEKIIFRGGSTGCGLTEMNNPRLRLSEISDQMKDPEHCDIGLHQLVNKVKVNDFTFGYIDVKRYQHLKKGFITPENQLEALYQLNIEGNSAAYRYGSLFNRQSIVIQTESDYQVWFEKFLKGDEYVILQKEVFMKEGDDLETSKKKFEEWMKSLFAKNQKEKMIEKGSEFFQKYIQKEQMCKYMFQIMCLQNQYYDYSS
jgi:hypothetical protein